MAERDKKGRFVKGHSGGPGRPRRHTEAEYIEATVGQVSLAKWQKVVNKALDDAMAGDRHARQFLADYLLGKPPQILELRGADAILLAQLLELCEQREISPGKIFEAMLVELTSQQVEVVTYG